MREITQQMDSYSAEKFQAGGYYFFFKSHFQQLEKSLLSLQRNTNEGLCTLINIRDQQ